MSRFKAAIFASGSGSNAENIANYVSDVSEYEVSLILTNNPNAFVINRAKNLGIPCQVFNKNQFTGSLDIVNLLQSNNIDYLILAGFLWKIPLSLIQAYPDKIINIHPALLPKYGGKGMYGENVHKAVIDNKENKSGITIHLVNEEYDKGRIIFQSKCEITPTDDYNSLAQKVHLLEYKHFPTVINNYILEKESQN